MRSMLLGVLMLSSYASIHLMAVTATTLGSIVTAPTGTVFFSGSGSASATVDRCACVSTDRTKLTAIVYEAPSNSSGAGLLVIETALSPSGVTNKFLTGTVTDSHYGDISAPSGEADLVAEIAHRATSISVGNTAVDVTLPPASAGQNPVQLFFQLNTTSCIFTAFTNLMGTTLPGCLGTITSTTAPSSSSTSSTLATGATSTTSSISGATSMTTATSLPSDASPSSSASDASPSKSSDVPSSSAPGGANQAPGGASNANGLNNVPQQGMSNVMPYVVGGVGAGGLVVVLVAGVAVYRLKVQRPVANLSKWYPDPSKV